VRFDCAGEALSKDDIGSGEPFIVERIAEVLIARMRPTAERPQGRASAEHLKPHLFNPAGDPESGAPTDLAPSAGPTASWWEIGPDALLSDFRPASATVQPTFPNSPYRNTSPAL
jgi:hypothetical protein